MLCRKVNTNYLFVNSLLSHGFSCGLYDAEICFMIGRKENDDFAHH
ncbi:MAG: hypothetical protein ACYC2U_06625 [Candidatus Amoebophilus sp.]